MKLIERIKSFANKIKHQGFSYVVSNSLSWHTDKMLMSMLRPLFIRVRLKDIIVLESHNDFDSNGGAFYDYLIKNGYNKKYKIVWMLKNPKPKNLPGTCERGADCRVFDTWLSITQKNYGEVQNAGWTELYFDTV